MIEINLLPVEEEVRAAAAPKGLGFDIPKMIPRGFGAAVVVVLAMYLLGHMRASSLEGSLQNSKQTLSDLERLSEEAKAIEQRLPMLRERAAVFQTRVENRKEWSELLQEIVLCCPEEIQLSEIRLSAPRSGTASTQSPKELLIKGFYLASGNPEDSEMKFSSRLRRSQVLTAHYQTFIPMTELKVGRTDFTIRCAEQ